MGQGAFSLKSALCRDRALFSEVPLLEVLVAIVRR